MRLTPVFAIPFLRNKSDSGTIHQPDFTSGSRQVLIMSDLLRIQQTNQIYYFFPNFKYFHSLVFENQDIYFLLLVCQLHCTQFNEHQLCLYGWAGGKFISSERNIIREANKNKTAESEVSPFYTYPPLPPSQALTFTPI